MKQAFINALADAEQRNLPMRGVVGQVYRALRTDTRRPARGRRLRG
jgi:hypothetical protein